MGKSNMATTREQGSASRLAGSDNADIELGAEGAFVARRRRGAAAPKAAHTERNQGERGHQKVQPGRYNMSMAPHGPNARWFEQQVCNLKDAAHAIAHKITGQREAAEDAVQEANIAAWRGFELFHVGTNFRAWYLKIVIRKALNIARRRPPEVPLLEHDLLDEQPNPEDQVLAKADQVMAWDVLEELRVVRPVDYDIFKRHFQGENYAEIACTWGQHENAVSRRTSRTHTLLADRINQLLCEPTAESVIQPDQRQQEWLESRLHRGDHKQLDPITGEWI
jgi:RNA polymerase sigma-70 factor (ECF subfamily)